MAEAEWFVGGHRMLKEKVDSYGRSSWNPSYSVIPNARADDHDGRNVAMGNVHKPSMVIRDIEVTPDGGEQIVGEYNPVTGKKKVLVMQDVSDPREEVAAPTIEKAAAAYKIPSAKSIAVMDDDTAPDYMAEIQEEQARFQNMQTKFYQEQERKIRAAKEMQAKQSFTVEREPPMKQRTAPAPNIPQVCTPQAEVPNQLVYFYTDEINLGIKYHEAILRGISLILVFDKRYTAATVPEFTTREDGKPFRIVIDGYPFMLTCAYYGQHFEHNNYVYTLFAVHNAEELKSE